MLLEELSMDTVVHNRRTVLRRQRTISVSDGADQRFIYLPLDEAEREGIERPQVGQGDGPILDRSQDLTPDLFYQVMRQVATDFSLAEYFIKSKMIKSEEFKLQEEMLLDVIKAAITMLLSTFLWLVWFLIWPRSAVNPLSPLYTVVFISHFYVAKSLWSTKTDSVIEKRMEPIQERLRRQRERLSRTIEALFYGIR